MKEARGKNVLLTYRGAKIRITSDFSSETMQTRRKWSKIFKLLREREKKNLEFSILQNFPSKHEGKIKTFSNKQKLKEFVASRPVM